MFPLPLLETRGNFPLIFKNNTKTKEHMLHMPDSKVKTHYVLTSVNFSLPDSELMP